MGEIQTGCLPKLYMTPETISILPETLMTPQCIFEHHINVNSSHQNHASPILLRGSRRIQELKFQPSQRYIVQDHHDGKGLVVLI